MSNNVLTKASYEWARRPADQRYLSIGELKEAVAKRKHQSWTATPNCKDLRVVTNGENLEVEVYDPTKGEVSNLQPTHWGFGQLAQYAGAPANYLRGLPPELTAINLQWGLEHSPIRENGLILAQSNGSNQMRAMTSVSYGRIWDSQVVDAVERVNSDGRWQVPAASYSTTNPKRATTLYASDQDVFMFLVDPERPIEVGKEKLFRGFMVWNSEVGASVFGLATFLYRYVCDNRLIWGATDVNELRIRHTGGAPERFAYEGQKYLTRYADESTNHIVESIKKAQEKDIPVRTGDTVENWLRERGFSKSQATASVQTAIAEEGQARSIWDIVNGVTAYARSVTHANERVVLETKAGDLMKYAS